MRFARVRRSVQTCNFTRADLLGIRLLAAHDWQPWPELEAKLARASIRWETLRRGLSARERGSVAIDRLAATAILGAIVEGALPGFYQERLSTAECFYEILRFAESAAS